MPSPIDHGSILITGASAGIGAELAKQMAPRARRLILVARRRDRLEALASELRATHPSLGVDVIECDLTDREACARLVETSGDVDVLVNNAGAGHHALFEQGRAAAYDAVMLLNVVAPTLLLRGLLPSMLERRRGGILNIGSGAGLVAMPGGAVYAGSKHFLHGLSATLQLELEGTGVHVTEVLPGPVNTEFDVVAGIGEEGGGVPHFFRVSAEQCAREAIEGFDRKRRAVYPGTLYRVLMLLRSILPSGLARFMMRASARRLRDQSARRPAQLHFAKL